jgi:hypothetical protein
MESKKLTPEEKARKEHALKGARATGYKTEEEIEEKNSLPELPPDPRHDVIRQLLKKYPSVKAITGGAGYLDDIINSLMQDEPKTYGNVTEKAKNK